jgi:hypothetical protein
MKKLLALLLALVMLLSLAACAEEDDEPTSRRRKKDTETTSDTTEETEETEPEETTAEDEKNRPQISDTYTVFEEMDTVIIDDEYVTLFISAPKADTWGGLICELEAENNSKRNIAVAAQCIAVNGKMTTDSLYVEVEKGDDADDEFMILDLTDEDELTRLTMLLTVYDTEEYDFTPNYMIDIYPQGIDAYEEPDIDRSGDAVLVDQYDIYAVTKAYGENDWDEYAIDFLAINDTDMYLSLQLSTNSINGFGFEDTGSWNILPGTYAEKQLTLEQYSSLKELGLDSVTEINMQVEVMDEDYDEIFSDPITLYPEGKGKTETFTYEYDKDDLTIAEGDEFKLTLAKTVTDEWDDTALIFVVENKYDSMLCIEGTNVKVNGKTVDGLGLYSYYTGSKDHHTVLNIYDFYLEDAKISDIETIEMDLVVENEEYEIIFKKTVTFNIA